MREVLRHFLGLFWALCKLLPNFEKEFREAINKN